MYSLVLMMAVSTAPDTANWGRHGWSSCHGCNGVSCHGGWSYGAHAFSSYACSGCAGNVTSYFSCNGCQGSYWEPFSCFGYGIYGGTSYYWPTPYGGGLPSVGYGYGYPQVPNSIPRIENKEEEKKDGKDKKPEPKLMRGEPSKAKVIVYLPADAKLFANGQSTVLTNAERVFNTPTLERGQDYQYELKAEYVRDGKTIIDRETIVVRAGETSYVRFNERTEKAVSSTDRFAAKP